MLIENEIIEKQATETNQSQTISNNQLIVIPEQTIPQIPVQQNINQQTRTISPNISINSTSINSTDTLAVAGDTSDQRMPRNLAVALIVLALLDGLLILAYINGSILLNA